MQSVLFLVCRFLDRKTQLKCMVLNRRTYAHILNIIYANIKTINTSILLQGNRIKSLSLSNIGDIMLVLAHSDNLLSLSVKNSVLSANVVLYNLPQTIRHVDFTNAFISSKNIKVLQMYPNLTSLVFKFTGIEGFCVIDLLTLSNLRKLTIHGLSISNDTEYIPINISSSLESLEIEQSMLSFSFIRSIASCLKPLTRLSLSNTNVSDDGILAIAQNLKSLKTLFISNVEITNVALYILAEYSKTLKFLDLSQNLITLPAIKHLIDNLELRSLNLEIDTLKSTEYYGLFDSIKLDSLKSKSRLEVSKNSDLIEFAKSISEIKPVPFTFLTPPRTPSTSPMIGRPKSLLPEPSPVYTPRTFKKINDDGFAIAKPDLKSIDTTGMGEIKSISASANSNPDLNDTTVKTTETKSKIPRPTSANNNNTKSPVTPVSARRVSTYVAPKPVPTTSLGKSRRPKSALPSVKSSDLSKRRESWKS